MFIVSAHILVISLFMLLSSVLLASLGVGAKHSRSTNLSDSREMEIVYMKNMSKMKNIKDMMTEQKLRHK